MGGDEGRSGGQREYWREEYEREWKDLSDLLSRARDREPASRHSAVSAALHDLRLLVGNLASRLQALEDLVPAARTEWTVPRDDPQEAEAYDAYLRAERALLLQEMRTPLSEPVSPGDRLNLAKVLPAVFDRVNRLELEVEQLRRRLAGEGL